MILDGFHTELPTKIFRDRCGEIIFQTLGLLFMTKGNIGCEQFLLTDLLYGISGAILFNWKKNLTDPDGALSMWDDLSDPCGDPSWRRLLCDSNRHVTCSIVRPLFKHFMHVLVIYKLQCILEQILYHRKLGYIARFGFSPTIYCSSAELQARSS